MILKYTYIGDIDVKLVAEAIIWIGNQKYDEPNSTLKFYISSCGGDIDSAIRLYDFLKSLPVEVETIGFGQVDSAALLIFLAGKKRTAIKNCRFRIHEGTFHTDLDKRLLSHWNELISLFKELDRRMKEIVSNETGKKLEEIKEMYAISQILTAEQAKQLGIVHEIVEKIS